MISLLKADEEIDSAYRLMSFSYPSPRINFDPRHRIPSIADLAGRLRTFLSPLAHDRPIVLVAHSMGGLVVQRYLAAALNSGEAGRLQNIRQIVMFACPNSGSEAFLLLRTGFFRRHTQVRELRPLTEAVLQAQRTVLDGIVHADVVSAHTCPIPLVAYAAERDNIVAPASARGIWPEAGVLPGDHSSIIRPDSRDDEAYKVLKRHLQHALRSSPPPSSPRDLAGMAASDDRRTLSELQSKPPMTVDIDGKPVIFQVHRGPVERLRDVSILVVPSNTYFVMSHFFRPSVSGRFRLAGAKTSDAGEILADLISDELTNWVREHARYGLPVEQGTVAITGAGALDERGISRLYHVAVAQPIQGTDAYAVNPHGVSRAVHECFRIARKEMTQLSGAGDTRCSICFPLLGSGRGGLSTDESITWMWEALRTELSSDSAWHIHFITWTEDQAGKLQSFLDRQGAAAAAGSRV